MIPEDLPVQPGRLGRLVEEKVEVRLHDLEIRPLGKPALLANLMNKGQGCLFPSRIVGYVDSRFSEQGIAEMSVDQGKGALSISLGHPEKGRIQVNPGFIQIGAEELELVKKIIVVSASGT